MALSTRALALLVAVLVGGCGTAPEVPGPSTPARSGASGTATQVDRGALAWVDRLPEGRPPRIGYAIGKSYTAPDGKQVQLRLRGRPGFTSVAPLGDDYLITTDFHFEGTTGVVRIGSDGRPVGRGRTIAGAPVRTAGTLRWITFTPPETVRRRTAHLHRADVASGTVTSTAFDPPRNWLPSLVGVIGQDLIMTDGYEGPTWVIGRSGASTLPGFAVTTSATSQLIAVATRTGRKRLSAGVIEHPGGEVLWHAKGVEPVAFSPRGDRLVARTRDGIALLDARTGDARAVLDHISSRDARFKIGQIAWEDDRTLLLGVQTHRDAAVVRVDPATGHWERAEDWTPAGRGGQVTFETRE
jgi:hypothetical protein